MNQLLAEVGEKAVSANLGSIRGGAWYAGAPQRRVDRCRPAPREEILLRNVGAAEQSW